jgi:predicted ThiF/HesA family dinucleotide-utilizing enzyme
MRHGRKSRARKVDGYKLHVTKEPASELITAIQVTAANTSDGDVAAELVRQADRNGAAASELVGDMAYGDGDTRAEVTTAGAQLTAKVPRPTTTAASPSRTSPSTRTCPRRPALPGTPPPG